jgi:dolichol-phosphate mannosyltransferase
VSDLASDQAASAPAWPTLAVIVPCYNEAPNVAPMVARLDQALIGIDFEVIFVDDNSPDGTAARARAIGAQDHRVRCLKRVGRRGLSSAVI